MDLTELEAFLEETSIPKIKTNPLTFQDISSQPHYENVMSNIYAFFLDSEGEHGFGKLFIKSLLELIKEAKPTKEFTSPYWSIEREAIADDKKRVDFKISAPEQAILIESKVYHTLNNDLDKYWKSAEDCNTRIGIVLSLYPIKETGHKEFINITHKSFIDKVKQNLGHFLINANDKYLILLKDFIQNIHNLSSNIMEASDIEFYIENNKKINEIIEFNNEFQEHFSSAVKEVCSWIEDAISYSNTNRLWYISSKQNKDLVFTIAPPDNGYNLTIVVELQGKSIKDCLKLNKKDFEKFESVDFDFFNKKDIKEDYFHFAGQWPYKLKSKELATLSETIIKLIEKDELLVIFNKLDEHLTSVRNKK